MKKDIEELYPNSVILNNYSDQLYINLDRLYREIGEKIIIIVDEWDSIFTNTKFTRKEQDKYVYFLKNLIKDQEYTFFVFMTGILSQTAINCFYEYSILQDEAYYQYFGFTEKEVRALCRKNKNTLKYEELESWYNGYKGYDGQRIFNPYSVIQSLQNNLIENYWTEVGHYDKLVNIINFNINGVKEEILDFILGKEISIHLNNFGVKDLQKELEKKEIESNETKEKFYSKMVTFGFLTYYDGKISIPNKELKEKFILALTENNDLKFYYGLIEKSENMLELILNKKTKEICEILKESHMNIIKLGDEMEQFKFKRFLEYVYFNANVNYNINDYVENEKGFIDYIDYIFYPKNKKKETVIIMRLKINESAKAAIRQIHENKYYYNLKNYGYEGNILLIGINCNSRTKNYSCIIEEYNSALNLLSSSELEKKRKIKPEPEIESDDTFKRLKNKKIKVKSESDGIFKRLRSSNKIKTN